MRKPNRQAARVPSAKSRTATSALETVWVRTEAVEATQRVSAEAIEATQRVSAAVAATQRALRGQWMNTEPRTVLRVRGNDVCLATHTRFDHREA